MLLKVSYCIGEGARASGGESVQLALDASGYASEVAELSSGYARSTDDARTIRYKYLASCEGSKFAQGDGGIGSYVLVFEFGANYCTRHVAED